MPPRNAKYARTTGTQSFSIAVSKETHEKITIVANATGLSRGEVANMLLSRVSIGDDTLKAIATLVSEHTERRDIAIAALINQGKEA